MARAAPSERETLAALQDEVAALHQQVDALTGSFETVVRTAVAEEVQRVAAELRHTVATLGRVLVRDLDGSTRSSPSTETPSSPSSGPPPPAERTASTTAEPSPDPADDEEVGAETASDPGAKESDSEKGRNWRRRKA